MTAWKENTKIGNGEIERKYAISSASFSKKKKKDGRNIIRDWLFESSDGVVSGKWKANWKGQKTI